MLPSIVDIQKRARAVRAEPGIWSIISQRCPRATTIHRHGLFVHAVETNRVTTVGHGTEPLRRRGYSVSSLTILDEFEEEGGEDDECDETDDTAYYGAYA